MRPDHITQWAIDDQDADGNELKIEPPVEIQQTGLLSRSPMARLWFNEILNNFSEWLNHLSDDPVGFTVMIRNAEAGSYNPVTERGWVTYSTDNTTVTGFTIYTRDS